MIYFRPQIKSILSLALFSFLALAMVHQANSETALKNISTQELVNLCMPRSNSWTHFCNGLIQGYLEIIRSDRELCIPSNLNRRDLVEILISPEIVVFSGWIDDWPALETTKIIFGEKFSCS